MTAANETTILIVDDDAANRYFKGHVLKRYGYSILEAGTGAQAMQIVKERGPALVVLDVRLPDANGMELCRRIKALNIGISVLQTSAAFTQTRDRVSGLEGGADAYLVEPIEPEELRATVEAILRPRRAERELRALNESLAQSVEARTTELVAATERAETEASARQEAEEVLRHAEKLDALGQLTGGVAHDFNNLLTAIIGNLDLMDRHGADGSPEGQIKRKRYIANARAAAMHCARLTQQLLAFARREPVKMEVVEINTAIRKAADLLSHAVGQSIQIIQRLSLESWSSKLDPSQLESALVNVSVNARDAMPKGGRFIISTQNFTIENGDFFGDFDIVLGNGPLPQDYTRITLEDQGSGMDPEILPHIFEPFFTTKDAGKGSGLGLSQVYGFIRQSGGYLGIRSRKGAGTTIALFLPRAVAQRRGINASEQTNASGTVDAPATGTQLVLVVEDNPLLRDLVSSMLDELGYRVSTAADGRQGLQMLKDDSSIALLFADIVLPHQFSGVDLAMEARKLYPKLKILLTSGFSTHTHMETSASHGFPVLLKPYTQDQLANRIRETLATAAPG